MSVVIKVFGLGSRGCEKWSKMRISRVPCVGEKLRVSVPSHVAGGAHMLECIVVEVVHYDLLSEELFAARVEVK